MDFLIFIMCFVLIGYRIGDLIFHRKPKVEPISYLPTEEEQEHIDENVDKMLEVISSVLIDGEEPPVQELKTTPEDIIDATMALKKLGYKQTRIKKAIASVVESNGLLNSADIVILALPILNN